MEDWIKVISLKPHKVAAIREVDEGVPVVSLSVTFEGGRYGAIVTFETIEQRDQYYLSFQRKEAVKFLKEVRNQIKQREIQAGISEGIESEGG